MMQSRNTVPVVIIAGYLGAGKTTFINNLLTNTNDRLIVIVNDFGSINIDAALIAEHHDDTIELTNGCICCAIGGSLADVMLDIGDRDVQPDAVIIECSGVADPTAVAANAYLGGFHLAAIITFVDAVHWFGTANDPLVKHVFWRQIDSADLIALSKCDLIDSTQELSLRTTVRDRRPNVPTMSTQLVQWEQILQFSPRTPRDALAPLSNAQFTSTLEHVDPALTESELHAYVAALPGNVVRVKGIATLSSGSFLVQRVGTRTDISRTNLAATGLVIITAD